MQRRDFLSATLASAASASLPLTVLGQANEPQVLAGSLSESARDIPVVDSYDVIVCGAVLPVWQQPLKRGAREPKPCFWKCMAAWEASGPPVA